MINTGRYPGDLFLNCTPSFSSWLILLDKVNRKCSFVIVTVMDKEMRVCVDPGGNGATMNGRGEGGPSPPGRGEDKQLVSNSGDR
jgi:hypothetical protein